MAGNPERRGRGGTSVGGSPATKAELSALAAGDDRGQLTRPPALWSWAGVRPRVKPGPVSDRPAGWSWGVARRPHGWTATARRRRPGSRARLARSCRGRYGAATGASTADSDRGSPVRVRRAAPASRRSAGEVRFVRRRAGTPRPPCWPARRACPAAPTPPAGGSGPEFGPPQLPSFRSCRLRPPCHGHAAVMLVPWLLVAGHAGARRPTRIQGGHRRRPWGHALRRGGVL